MKDFTNSNRRFHCLNCCKEECTVNEICNTTLTNLTSSQSSDVVNQISHHVMVEIDSKSNCSQCQIIKDKLNFLNN